MSRTTRLAARISAGIFVTAVIGVVVAAFFIEEPLRRWMERQINAPLKGYSVRIGGLDLHPFTFSLTLERLVVRQDAHPEPPLVVIPRVDGGIDWRALLSLTVVARVQVQHPEVHLNLPQLREEVEDSTPIAQKGWQEAIENVSTLDLNEVRVIGGKVTYLDEPGAKPIEIDSLNARASNIRNVRSAAGAYPSPIHVDARLLGAAALKLDGKADFLAEPRAAGRAELALSRAPIERMGPAARHFGLDLRGGVVSARGVVESTAKATNVALRDVTVEKVEADYVETTKAPTPEKQVAKTAASTATTASTDTGIRIQLDALDVRNSSFGFVNATVDPHYRLFVDVASASLRDFSNGKRSKPAPLAVDGRFMGSGSLRLRGTIRPDHEGPDLDLSLQMEHVDVRTLNDLLRAHARLDVAAGELSVYSEVAVRERNVSGYVKPLFVDLDIYDRSQDRDEPITNQLYQGAVGALATVLQNPPREQVATVTPIAGRLDAVDADEWRSLVLLLRNAFVEAIRPGFERKVSG